MKSHSTCWAAFSQADITPDFPVELIGCDRPDNTAQGILHPLCVQVLLLSFQGEWYCLIAIDNLGFTTALSDELRDLAAKTLETRREHVMLNFSHTHSAPAPLSPLNGARYFRLLCDRVLTCMQAAMSRLRPCWAAWDRTETKLAENRRDGCNAVDSRLGALQIVHAETGEPIVLLLRCSAHANVLMEGNNRISGDWFGLARERLAACYGYPVIMIQGAAGNLKPAGVDKIRGGTLADAKRIAGILIRDAGRLRFAPGPVERLEMRTRELELHSDVPSEAQAERIAGEAKRLFGLDGTQWLAECARLRGAGTAGQTLREEMQCLFLNEGCLCGVPDEIFCEIALEAARTAKAPFFFLNGYTNGCTGYLPHDAEWEKGGYETLYSYLIYYPFHGHVMPFRKETARRIAAAAAEEWERYQNGAGNASMKKADG
ncbi:MAG: hypothetical protein LIO46_03700 [Clostridiales bacterium]|nr:hypothetical protein [Clostridiales bacterium]